MKARGVKTVDLWVSDGNQAMLNAIRKKFPDAARQRCVVHEMDNVREICPDEATRSPQTGGESLVRARKTGKLLTRQW